MYGFLLKVQTIGNEDQEIEQRLGHGHSFDEQRESIRCGLEAVETYDEDAIEETYGREIMQAHDAGYYKIILGFRRSDHGGWWCKALWPAQGLANSNDLVVEVRDSAGESIEGLNSLVAA